MTKPKWSQLLSSILLMFLIWYLPQPALADVNSENLASIIRTREIALEALNTRDFSKVAPYLHPEFTITTVDNQIFRTASQFEQYWNQQFSSTIKEIKMELKDDTLRTFLTPEIEVASGEATSSFFFQDGKSADMGLRWTAVLQKSADKWLIQSLHFSSNLLDNPVLNASQTAGKILAVISGLGGLVVGIVVMFFLRGRNLKSN
jgi:ketosteroid isomerase-like protein